MKTKFLAITFALIVSLSATATASAPGVLNDLVETFENASLANTTNRMLLGPLSPYADGYFRGRAEAFAEAAEYVRSKQIIPAAYPVSPMTLRH